jgi:hypothetical protein
VIGSCAAVGPGVCVMGRSLASVSATERGVDIVAP